MLRASITTSPASSLPRTGSSAAEIQDMEGPSEFYCLLTLPETPKNTNLYGKFSVNMYQFCDFVNVHRLVKN